VAAVAVHRLIAGRRFLPQLGALVLVLGLIGCDAGEMPRIEPQTGGNPQQGRELMVTYGCGACHTVPGVRRADGLVGPRLADLRERTYIAGVVPNTPANLVRWIEQPQAFSPRTAMPDVGASEVEARDIAAYLYLQ
jgi:cytochrome c